MTGQGRSAEPGAVHVEGFAVPKGTLRPTRPQFVKFALTLGQSIFAHRHRLRANQPRRYEIYQKERAEILPTAPTHLKEMFQLDHEYGKTGRKGDERFDTWLLS